MSRPEQPAKEDNIIAFGRSPLLSIPSSGASIKSVSPLGLSDSKSMFSFQTVVTVFVAIFKSFLKDLSRIFTKIMTKI
jgi:hypothetical protein